MPDVATWLVVPHAGDVDRIKARGEELYAGPVVPHAGDVDRNTEVWLGVRKVYVVPHAGDVDRNTSSKYCPTSS